MYPSQSREESRSVFYRKKRVDKYHPNMRESPPHTDPELARVGVSEKGTHLSIVLCL